MSQAKSSGGAIGNAWNASGPESIAQGWRKLNAPMTLAFHASKLAYPAWQSTGENLKHVLGRY